MQSKKRILITGGAGFIGSNLVRVLIDHGFHVTVLDNFDSFYARNIKENNIKAYQRSAQFSFIEGDIRDTILLRNIFEKNSYELVVHLAAKAGVRPSIIHKSECIDVNVAGTLNILEIMKAFGVSKLIFASSSSVYGNNLQTPYSENDNVDHPISPYAASKKAGELLTHTFHHLDNLDVINLRFFTVYGPHQRPDLAIHKFFKNLYRNTPIDIYGDGSTSRDYTYIEDILEGILGSIKYLQENKNVYEIINLGNSHPIKLMDLLELIEQVTGKKFVKKYLPMQAGDVNCTYADIIKAKQFLSYHPRTTIVEGLTKFQIWFENHSHL